jgi:hypothetical protein
VEIKLGRLASEVEALGALLARDVTGLATLDARDRLRREVDAVEALVDAHQG